MKNFELTVKYIMENRDRGIKFKPLDLGFVNTVVATTTSLENWRESKIQVGFYIMIVDGTGNANIVNYG